MSEQIRIGKLNIQALDGKRYFFLPTAHYNECPHCHVLCEIQAWYYGSYVEGPGFIQYLEEPQFFRCPSCLDIVHTIPSDLVGNPIARWECIGNDVVAED